MCGFQQELLSIYKKIKITL